MLTKRALAERAYDQLSVDGAPVSAAQLAAAAGLSASYARALVAEFHARPATTFYHNGGRPTVAAAQPNPSPGRDRTATPPATAPPSSPACPSAVVARA